MGDREIKGRASLPRVFFFCFALFFLFFCWQQLAGKVAGKAKKRTKKERKKWSAAAGGGG